MKNCGDFTYGWSLREFPYLEVNDSKVCKADFRTPLLEWCKNGKILGTRSFNGNVLLELAGILFFSTSDKSFIVDWVDPVKSSKSVKQFHKSSLNSLTSMLQNCQEILHAQLCQVSFTLAVNAVVDFVKIMVTIGKILWKMMEW